MPEPIRSEKPPLNSFEKSFLQAGIVESLRTVHDPHISTNIYDLGLIYDVSVAENRDVNVLMTLTSELCPYAQMLVGDVEEAVRQVSGVGGVAVEVTFDPPWTMESMSEDIRLMLGL